MGSFHPAVLEWFDAVFAEPTAPQKRGWPAIARGESTLILAPTGSGKTLTAFLWCLNRLMFEPVPERKARCRVLYVSPLKALAVDVERNLRAPLAGIANVAAADGTPFTMPELAIRTGDTPAQERARSAAGVSPVRTAMRAGVNASPRRSAACAMPWSGARRLRSTSTASALSGDT